MMGKTHIMVGVTYGVLLLPSVVTTKQYTPIEFSAIVGGLVLGSLLPDLDHPHSFASQFIPLVGRFVSSVTRHRGLLHSVLGVLMWFVFSASLTSIVSAVVGQPVPIVAKFSTGLIMGYILHIVADMMTVSGVKLFYPLKQNIELPLVKTGGIREMMFRWSLLAVCVYRIVSLWK